MHLACWLGYLLIVQDIGIACYPPYQTYLAGLQRVSETLRGGLDLDGDSDSQRGSYPVGIIQRGRSIEGSDRSSPKRRLPTAEGKEQTRFTISTFPDHTKSLLNNFDYFGLPLSNWRLRRYT
jgi:hypothetical protein